MSEQDETEQHENEHPKVKKDGANCSEKDHKKCNNCKDCHCKKDCENPSGPAPAEFIEDLERKWSSDDEIDIKEQNPKKIFNSLKKKIFNFR